MLVPQQLLSSSEIPVRQSDDGRGRSTSASVETLPYVPSLLDSRPNNPGYEVLQVLWIAAFIREDPAFLLSAALGTPQFKRDTDLWYQRQCRNALRCLRSADDSTDASTPDVNRGAINVLPFQA